MNNQRDIKILYVFFKDFPWDVRADKITQSLKNAGFKVSIAARSVESNEFHEERNGIYIYRVGAGKKNSYSLPFNFNPLWKQDLSKIASITKPDIIIVREMIIAKTAAIIAKRMNIPVIMDMAENYPAAMREWKKYNDSALSKFLVHNAKIPDKIERSSVRLMDGILTVCEEQIRRLNIKFHYPEKNITVVHNTPEESTFEKAEKGVVNDDLVLCHHGFLTSEKSIMNFLKGFIKFKNETSNNIKMVIAGSGDNFGDYQKVIKDHKAENFVIMTGEYKPGELAGIISGIDIGLIPYPKNDFNNYTIHNKIFDYFAAGKPVITSEAAPLKRIIAQTKAGISIDCEDPDQIFANMKMINEINWKELGKNAQKAYNGIYNWKNDEKTLIGFIKRYLNA